MAAILSPGRATVTTDCMMQSGQSEAIYDQVPAPAEV